MLCNRFAYLSEFELKLRNINTCAMSSMRHTVSRIKLLSCACRKFSEAMMVRAAHARYRTRGSIIQPAYQTVSW